ncbi:MAG TPA: PRC-barrel domain-containing protein [Candidatus Thermoplasmatota archaeon]|nr:PRC-barrel domain-containing protein [Candidatus Thermoplasmatota archaeon]
MESLWRTGDLIGKTVVDERGARVGVVDDLNLSPQGWRVDGLLVTLDNKAADMLGERKPLFGHAQVNIRTGRVQTAGDVVILSGTLDELAVALREAHRGEQAY